MEDFTIGSGKFRNFSKSSYAGFEIAIELRRKFLTAIRAFQAVTKFEMLWP